MPHGQLTPLGHRLRSVLAALRPNTFHLDNGSTAPKQLQSKAHYTTNALNPRQTARPIQRHVVAPTTTVRSQQTAAALATDHTESTAEYHVPRPSLRPISRRHENRRTKVDYLGGELRRVGRDDVAPKIPHGRARGNHFDHRSLHGKQLYAENRKRHATDNIPPLKDTRTLSLVRILASYIRHVADTASGNLQVSRSIQFDMGLSHLDKEFLALSDYDLRDVKAWAAVIMEPDSFKAASIVHARALSHGTRSVPLPILNYVLRRPYVTAGALRILIEHNWNLFDELNASSSTVSPDTVFVVFVRLSRHAREVWPEALPTIADFLIKFMPEVRPGENGDETPLARAVSHMLNKAMILLSEPTSIAPFRDINHQEAAIVRILSAMDNHDPSFQIQREGYRAVVRIQLASEKTESEERWADLKALSWPPWKEDRTSMDSELGPEHGISRARATLQRMDEAGYKPKSWEKVAGLFTGWDIDGTPTIQTRVILPIWREPTDEKSADYYNASLWAARIRTTRTVQEAWACYLAYEDSQTSIHQDVILAILEKLHEEGMRQRRSMKPVEDISHDHDGRLPRLFPGDTKEVAPLPPSTHLYTYTRTTPPSAHDFYSQLRNHDVDLRDKCLAYLISNAISVKTGVEYLKTAHILYPAVLGMVAFDPDINLDEVPAVLLEAYVKFLARFSNVVIPVHFAVKRRNPPVLHFPSPRLTKITFNFHHSLVQAIWLLKTQRPRFLPAWNAVLDALANSKSYERMHLVESQQNAVAAINRTDKPDVDANAILAYRLTQQVLRLLQAQHMTLDPSGFLALCRSTENVGIASWKILNQDHRSRAASTEDLGSADEAPIRFREAKELLTKQRPQLHVQRHFKLLVGDESFLARYLHEANPQPSDPKPFASPATDPGLPRLLTAPSPAIMHAYIRALGWCGSHDRILETLRWMVEYQHELAVSASRGRNGARIVRRTIIAVKVFLERSWLPADSAASGDFAAGAEAGGDKGSDAAASDGKSAAFRRLEATASAEQLDEARSLVGNVPGWGGWATDREVEGYLKNGRFAEFRVV